MKAKALLFTALFLAIATQVSAAAPSTEVNNGVSPSPSLITSLNGSSNEGNNDNGIITPQAIGGNFGETETDPDGTATSNFVVPGGYGYVKIYFKNNSSSPVSVVVTHYDTKKVYVNKKISGGGSYTWYSTDDNPQGVRAGQYEVTFRGGGDGTKPVNASYKGFATDNTADFGR
ncbi:hypothetical protein [Paenibacillus sp. SN-8-1]|uniref:hypothetical protein n=1 Tax=Paenibacillus sp. SN-8-1 TaxID=3435409 RepID=UPI003D9A3355